MNRILIRKDTLENTKHDIPSASRLLASYIFWLEYEHTSSANGRSRGTRQAWDNKRLACLLELMQAMKLDANRVVAKLGSQIEAKD
jgi:hypothetical protein